MLKRMAYAGILLTTALLPATGAGAQVVVGPGNPVARPGEVTNVAFVIAGASAADAAVIRFSVSYDPSTSAFDPVTKPDGQPGEVDCTVEPDLASRISLGPVFSQPDRMRIVVSFGDLTFPIAPLGRDGVIVRCLFTIKPDVAPGTYPLACAGSVSASGADGTPLSATCDPGTLTIEAATDPTATSTMTPTDTPTNTPTATSTPTAIPTSTLVPSCVGDKDNNRTITGDEVVLTVRAFSEDDVSLNPAADADHSLAIEANEVVEVLINFSLDECNCFAACRAP